MVDIWEIAWSRFQLIAASIADAQARIVLSLFYFTILVPFGVGSTLFSDPMRRKKPSQQWLERQPVPDDIDSARQQG